MHKLRVKYVFVPRAKYVNIYIKGSIYANCSNTMIEQNMYLNVLYIIIAIRSWTRNGNGEQIYMTFKTCEKNAI